MSLQSGDSLGYGWKAGHCRPAGPAQHRPHGSERSRTAVQPPEPGHYEAIHEASGAQVSGPTEAAVRAAIASWLGDQLKLHSGGWIGKTA